MTNAEAIEEIKSRISTTEYVGGSYVDCVDLEALKLAIKALEAQKWIPCSERLPEVGRSVLFSRRSMCTREGCLQADGKWWQYWWDEMLNADQVTAWKPLPEPYREDENETD